VKMFNADKTRMIGLSYMEKNYHNMLSRFYPIPERHGQTDRQTDRIVISMSRVSVLTCDNKSTIHHCLRCVGFKASAMPDWQAIMFSTYPSVRLSVTKLVSTIF